MKRLIIQMAMAASATLASAQTTQTRSDSLLLDTLNIHQLQEVVIKGMLPNTRLKGNAMVTRITGSVLEKAGTANDVLRRVPGIIKKGEDLEVIGRGKPVYYINGRKVYDGDELKRLMSDKIANVEVITNPGAAYDATVSAVVRIKTVRRQGDGFGFGLFGKSEQSLRTGTNDPELQLNANYRYKGVDFFASAKEWRYTTHQWSDLGQWTSDPTTGEELFRYGGTLDYKWRGIGTHLNTGFNWQINDNHSLGAKVDYSVTTDADTRERLDMTKHDHGTLTETVKSDGTKWSDRPDNILVNAYYNGNAGKLNIDFNTDVYINNDNTHQSTKENATADSREVESVSTSKNQMVATKLVLTYPIAKGMLSFGTEETFVRRDNDDRSTGTGLPDARSKVKDDTYAAFVQYAVALGGNTHVTAGLRYEHAGFDYRDCIDAANNLHRSYNNLFPSAAVSTAFGKVRLSLNYASRTQRPSFWQLNNSMQYHNRYVVQQGNATLKPSTEHTVGITAMYSLLTVGANYSCFNDLVCNWSEQMNDEGMIRVSYKNIDRPQRQLNLFAVATRTWGCYTPSWTVAYVKQWLTLDFDNGRRSFGRPMWVFNANNAFRFAHDWQLEANSEFHSKANYSNVELINNYWSMETVVQKSLLKDKSLTLRLSWQDMFRKGNNDVYIDYGSYNIFQTNKMDFNRLVFTVRYNFNAARSKYKGTGAGQDARNRIGSSSR